MSLQTELSGLQAAQSNIDTIGNNVANVNTVGFKSFFAELADSFSTGLGGAGSSVSPGNGVSLAGLSQLFTQGGLLQTGNPLDVAVSGGGFFTLMTASGPTYTRDGSFLVSNSGYLESQNGGKVMGFATSGSGALQPLQINTASLPASATSSLSMDMNLPTTDAAINTTTTPFSTTNPASYDESTSTTVYDSMGTSLTLTTYYTQVSGSGTPNKWATHYQLTDSSGTTISSGAGPTMSFDSAGQLTAGSGSIGPISNLPDGAAALNIDLNYTNSTLSAASFGVSSITNNGSAGGQFTGIAINANGQVVGQYSNGASKTFGTIALANFQNTQGLQPLSQNMWAATQASGPPALGVPGTTGLGALQAGALEGSNVDISSQLVNLIVAQQAYQANVQGINVDQQDVQRLLTIQ